VFLHQSGYYSKHFNSYKHRFHPYLIIALSAPVLQATSWQNAVNPVSGEDIFEEVTLDATLKSGAEFRGSVCSGLGELGPGTVLLLLFIGAVG
jgi:hypothetical protein